MTEKYFASDFCTKGNINTGTNYYRFIKGAIYQKNFTQEIIYEINSEETVCYRNIQEKQECMLKSSQPNQEGIPKQILIFRQILRIWPNQELFSTPLFTENNLRENKQKAMETVYYE